MTPSRKKISLLAVLTLLLINTAIAQTPAISGRANHDKIGINDQVEVAHSLVGDNYAIGKASFSDFTLIKGPYQNKTETMVMTSGKPVNTVAYTWTYTLKPKRTGQLIISPITVFDQKGNTIRSKELTIEVVEGGK
jgi:BatD DUF11 like domain